MAPTESIAVTVKEKLPGVVGVPERIPAPLRVRPGGSVAELENVKDPVPPEALTLWLYNRPAVQSGNAVVRISTGKLRVIVYTWTAREPRLSKTAIPKGPPLSGVPERTPLEYSVSPLGAKPPS
jgi:hypothetical protein